MQIFVKSSSERARTQTEISRAFDKNLHKIRKLTSINMKLFNGTSKSAINHHKFFAFEQHKMQAKHAMFCLIMFFRIDFHSCVSIIFTQCTVRVVRNMQKSLRFSPVRGAFDKNLHKIRKSPAMNMTF